MKQINNNNNKKAGETGIEGKPLWSVFLGKVKKILHPHKKNQKYESNII